MKFKIIDTAQHRNDVCGAPFGIVLFKDRGAEELFGDAPDLDEAEE